VNAVQPPLELERPRDFSEILKTSLSVYGANFGTLLAIAATVVVAVDLVVQGVGMEQLWAEYDETPPAGELILTSIVSALVTTPLVSAMIIFAVIGLGEGRKPSAGSSIQRGLDVFAPLFMALLLVLAGVVLGLLLLVIPGVYLAVRWYFVTPAVVVEGARGAAALRRSSELVRGNWWRVFGILVGTGLVAALPTFAVAIPFGVMAEASDLDAPALAGTILGETLVGPFGALVLALLYFDLRSRHRAAQIPGAVSAPPDPPGLPPQP